jgi:hypothetical protein
VFLFRLANQLPQMLTICLCVQFQECSNSGVTFLYQAIPPDFQLMMSLCLLAGFQVSLPEILLNRFRVDVPHQFADVLQVPLAGTVGVQAFGLFQRKHQILRKSQR